MIPAAFEYHTPGSIKEATALLARLGEDAKVLSGGQSLIPLMKLRLASPRHVVDINGIEGLDGVREADGFLRIGALTRESDLEAVGGRPDPLSAAPRHLQGDRRSAGAQPGHGRRQPRPRRSRQRPPGDHAGARRRGRRGRDRRASARSPSARSSPARSRPRCSPTRSWRRSGSRLRRPRSGGAYVKLERKVGDFATAAVAVQVALDGRRHVRAGRDRPHQRRPDADQGHAGRGRAQGQAPDAAAHQARPRELAAAAAQPSADLRGSVEYKRDLVRVLDGARAAPGGRARRKARR